jgi:hypothetical protein
LIETKIRKHFGGETLQPVGTLYRGDGGIPLREILINRLWGWQIMSNGGLIELM